MQRVVAADLERQIGLLGREHRRTGERDEDLIDIFGGGAGGDLLRVRLPEEQVEAAVGEVQVAARHRLKIDAHRVPLRVILQREHRFDLLRADPEIVAAVGGVQLAGVGVSREIGEIVARRI